MNAIGASGLTAITGGVDVDALAETVRSCRHVSDLAPGGPGSPATYLPGRRVAGIAVDDTRVRIQVRSGWAAPALLVVSEIRAAVRPFVGDRMIDVTIADIEDPPEDRPSIAEGPSATATPLLDPTAAPHPERPEVGAPRVGPPVS